MATNNFYKIDYEKLLTQLESKALIRKKGSNFEILKFNINESYLDSPYKVVEDSIKLMLQDRRLISEKITKIAERLESLVPSTMRHSNDFNELILIPLDEAAPHLVGTEELEVYKKCGLTSVIQHRGKKWSRAAMLKASAVLFLGILQIVAGAVILVLSAGSMTFVASAFFSEGIGDVIFAISSYISGHFSWKDYAWHKAISLAITVLTCGVGALLNRGKSVLGFGYKLYGSAVSASGNKIAIMSGKELIKNVGIKALAKEVFKTTVKSVGKAAVMAGVSYGVDLLVEKQLDGFIRSTVSYASSNIETRLKESDIQDVLQSLYKDLGKDKLLSVIQSLVNDTIKFWAKAREWESQIAGAIDSTSQTLASSKNKIVKGTQRVLTVISFLQKTSLLARLFDHAKIIISGVETELKNKQITVVKVVGNSAENIAPWDSVRNEFVEAFKTPIVDDITNIMNHQIIGPILKRIGNEIVFVAGRFASKAVNAGMELKLKRDFKNSSKILETLKDKADLNVAEKSLKEKNENKLRKIIMKTRDPKLMAASIRGGDQMNMVGAEAIAAVLLNLPELKGKFSLAITQENGDVHTYGDPGGKEIKLVLKDNHFTNNNTKDTSNDCLFNALKQQIPELRSMSNQSLRNLAAAEVVSNPRIKENVRMGFHKNTMRRGAFGGNIVSLMSNMSEEERIRYFEKTGLQRHEAIAFEARRSAYFMDRRIPVVDGVPVPVLAGQYKELDILYPNRYGLLEHDHVPSNSSQNVHENTKDKGRSRLAIALFRKDHRMAMTTGRSTIHEDFSRLIQTPEGFVEMLKKVANDYRSIAGGMHDEGFLQAVRLHRNSGKITARQAEEIRESIVSTHLDVAKGWPQERAIRTNYRQSENGDYFTHLPSGRRNIFERN